MERQWFAGDVLTDLALNRLLVAPLASRFSVILAPQRGIFIVSQSLLQATMIVTLRRFLGGLGYQMQLVDRADCLAVALGVTALNSV